MVCQVRVGVLVGWGLGSLLSLSNDGALHYIHRGDFFLDEIPGKGIYCIHGSAIRLTVIGTQCFNEKMRGACSDN